MRPTVAASIVAVVIDRADKLQTKLTPEDEVYGLSELGVKKRLRLCDIPDVLANPAAWIEYPTVAVWTDEERDEMEPWQQAESESSQRAFARLYARSVIEVMVVYDEPAE